MKKGARNKGRAAFVGLILLSAVILTLAASDTTPPGISFISPTPANATSTSDTSMEINISITNASDLDSFKLNWNGTNTTVAGINSTILDINVTLSSLNGFSWKVNGSSYNFYNDSLILMLNFDNVSALGENETNVVDVSEYGNNGTLNGGIALTTGKYGKALQFDGIDDYLQYPVSILDGAAQGTFEAWVYPTGIPGIGYYSTGIAGFFWGKPGSTDTGFGFTDDSSQKIKIRLSGVDLVSNSTLPFNTWSYIVAT